jgi:type IV pilus assembly protein PilB
VENKAIKDIPSSLLLFEKFKHHFDQADNLVSPGDKASLISVWSSIASQLNIDSIQVAKMLGELSNLEIAENIDVPLDTLINKIPYKLAITVTFLPLREEEKTTIIAISNPFDDHLHEMIQFSFGINYRCVITPPKILEMAIASAYDNNSSLVEKGNLNLDENKLGKNEEKQVPKLARQILQKAIHQNASDLHIQPFVGGSAVRIRVDGILNRISIIPNNVSQALLRYFKSLGGMDPTSTILPQDGRVSLNEGKREYDLRISVIPIQGRQEKLVIRFLNRDTVYNLSTSSFSLDEIHTLRRMAANPSGVVLICGPTGSGKTTTLYSILSELNVEGVSIATVENPVEYNMPGLAQTEVNEKSGLTFAKVLRSVLRQDPDIILIGEIRDQETARIAMQSALTGHLVFSTLHTNDALSAIPRLLDLEIQPAILSDSLAGIVSQRLLRRLCENCSVKAELPLTQVEEVFCSTTKVKPGKRPVGCDTCNYTGYKGRLVITEMIEVSSELRELLRSGEKDLDKLRQSCEKQNQNLSLSASRLIISGETAAEEAFRVIGRQFWIDLARQYKTEIPNINQLNHDNALGKSSNASILLTGGLEYFTQDFQKEMGHGWLNTFLAESPEQAKSILKENENIDLVIVDIDDHLNEKEVIDLIDEYRAALAWSRLPALIRLPEGKDNLKEILQKEGATSRFINKTAPVNDIISEINEALTKNMDYSWGSDNSAG